MNYSTHTLINSHKRTMVPHAFGKDYFKGLWDGLSKVSQLAHDMLWWLVFLGPCWRWWLCWLQTVALGSLLSAVQANNAQFQLVSEVSKWNGGQCQSMGSKQDNHIQTGAACSSQLMSCWSLTHLFEKNMSYVLPTKGTYISHSQAFFPNWGKEKVYKVRKVPKNP